MIVSHTRHDHLLFHRVKKNTIVALSTPPGRSGIGVIRLSGERSLDYVRQLLLEEKFSPEPHRVALKKFLIHKAANFWIALLSPISNPPIHSPEKTSQN